VHPQLEGAPVLFAASQASGQKTWFEDLLEKAGVDPSSAQSVNQFVLRPIEVIVVIVVAALVAHYGARIIRRTLGAVGRPAAGRSRSPRAESRLITVVALISNIWRFFVAVVAIFIILGMLGLDLTPLLASATVIGATIGFGAQSLVRDYLSGILLTVEDQFGIGDTLSVNDVTGVVEDLSLRVTRLRAADGTVVYVPNGDIRKLANTSRGWAKATVDVPLPVLGSDGLERVHDALSAAARSVAREPRFAAGCTEPPEILGIVDATTEGATFRVAQRTTPTQRAPLERALRQACLGAVGDIAASATGSTSALTAASPPPPPEDHDEGVDGA